MMINPETAIDYPVSDFILKLCQTTLCGFPWIRVTEINFDLRYFDNSLFARYKITPPVHLNRAVNKRRGEYLASRYAARIALASAGIIDFLLNNDHRRAPVWPARVTGSLTHTARRAVILTAPADHQCLLGVDAEQWIATSVADHLSEMIASETELNYLSASGLPFASALTLVFSLKESLYKAIPAVLQTSLDFHSAELIELDVKRGCACLQLTRTLSQDFPQGRRFYGYFSQQPDEVLTMVVDSST